MGWQDGYSSDNVTTIIVVDVGMPPCIGGKGGGRAHSLVEHQLWSAWVERWLYRSVLQIDGHGGTKRGIGPAAPAGIDWFCAASHQSRPSQKPAKYRAGQCSAFSAAWTVAILLINKFLSCKCEEEMDEAQFGFWNGLGTREVICTLNVLNPTMSRHVSSSVRVFCWLQKSVWLY